MEKKILVAYKSFIRSTISYMADISKCRNNIVELTDLYLCIYICSDNNFCDLCCVVIDICCALIKKYFLQN